MTTAIRPATHRLPDRPSDRGRTRLLARMGHGDNPRSSATIFADASEFSLYLSEIARYPLLTPAEELAAARLSLVGDPAARDLLIRSNLRLVVKIARGYAGRGMPVEDLVADGTLGLIRAVEDFDPELGFRLTTYSVAWIKSYVRRAIVNRAAIVRVPAGVFQKAGEFRRAEAHLARSSDHAPTFDEVADAMGVNATDRRSLALARRALRVRTGVTGAEGESAGDVSKDPIGDTPTRSDADGPDAGWAAISRSEDALMLGRLLGCLDDRERAVIVMRYGLGGAAVPQFHKVIARRMGVSPELARQIWRRAMEKMRRMAEEKGWGEYGREPA